MAPKKRPRARSEAPLADDIFEIPVLTGRELDRADPVERFLMDIFGMDYWFDATFESHPRNVYEYNFGPQDGPVRVAREWRTHRADMMTFLEALVYGESGPPREVASSSRTVSRIPRPVAGPSSGAFALPSLREVLGDNVTAQRRMPRNGSGPGRRRPRELGIVNRAESTESVSLSAEPEASEADRRERERRQVRMDSEMPIDFPQLLQARRGRGADAVSEGSGNGNADGGVLLRDAYDEGFGEGQRDKDASGPSSGLRGGDLAEDEGFVEE